MSAFSLIGVPAASEPLLVASAFMKAASERRARCNCVRGDVLAMAMFALQLQSPLQWLAGSRHLIVLFTFCAIKST